MSHLTLTDRVIDFTDLFGLESSWGPGVPVLGLASLVGLEDYGDVLGVGSDISWGPGLWVILVGSLVALVGGVATVAKRRK